MKFIRMIFGAPTRPMPAPVPITAGKNTFRFIGLDVETANSHPGSICQIGLAFVHQNNQIEVFSTLIDPRAPFDAFNTRIHGIDAKAVRKRPTFQEAFQHIAPLLIEQPIIQHSTFDQRAIEAACRDCGIDPPSIEWLDSVRIARRAWPELRGNGGHGLANLKSVLNLQFNHHDAGEDAPAAAEIVLAAEQRTKISFKDLATTAPQKVQSSKVQIEGVANGPLTGQTAVFTGALTMSRQQAAQYAASSGISVKNTVTARTTLLIVGDQDLTQLAGHTKSSKHRRAEELIDAGAEIRIIGESEFMHLLDTRPEATNQAPATSADTVIIVFDIGLTLPHGMIARYATEAGMSVMKNITKRTEIFVVPDDGFSRVMQETARRRKADQMIANGHTLKVIEETQFLRMIGIME